MSTLRLARNRIFQFRLSGLKPDFHRYFYLNLEFR
jgi:hypothetical protein